MYRDGVNYKFCLPLRHINKKHIIMKKILFLLVMVLPVLVFTSCSDDDNEGVNTKKISLFVGDEKKIESAVVPNSVFSENNFIAEVEDDGTVIGKHVGQTIISINEKYNIPVEIKGKYTTYDDPILNWGCSADYIIKNQKQGTLNSQNATSITYTNCGKAQSAVYLFEEGKLVSAGFVLRSSLASEIGDFLDERYLMIPYDLGDYTIAGINSYKLENASNIVFVKVYNVSTIMVLYAPYDNERSIKSISPDKEIISIKMLEEKLSQITDDIQ